MIDLSEPVLAWLLERWERVRVRKSAAVDMDGATGTAGPGEETVDCAVDHCQRAVRKSEGGATGIALDTIKLVSSSYGHPNIPSSSSMRMGFCISPP